EGNTNIQVVRKLSLGGTTVCFDGLRSGSIDLYPEYDGTAYTIHLGHTERIRDPAMVYSAVKREFEQRFQMTWTAPFGFNNYFALAMPQPLAQQYGIRTVSQLAPLSNRFVFGTTNEFMGRPLDGYVPLAATYGLQFRAVRTMMTGLRYNAIQANDIQVMDAYATDAKLRTFNLLLLEDDKGFFPPYNGAMIIRTDTLANHPELLNLINRLGGTMNNELVRSLNYRVEVLGQGLEEVARDFLRSHGLVPTPGPG
ncbi:MAG: glycine betaine/carnitine/choline transporter substrate-binding protein, partial [Firmicutes bacterium]|nr:glycine betaine/carnitine/choline transporter substrate-binding protein [Bacillota bacterium]